MPARRAALADRERPGDRAFALGDNMYERYLKGVQSRFRQVMRSYSKNELLEGTQPYGDE